jgi:hypothetical protein
MNFLELIEVRHRYQKKHDEISEQLRKGNPLFINGRKLTVFEMSYEKSFLARLIKKIDSLEINIDEEIINPTVRR